jgi:type II secretory pathway pseudopilin PulG
MKLFRYSHTKTRLKNNGDTIIEVLIALAVISLVLVGAYVSTQKSTLDVRDSQEHTEALKLLQTQIESIKGLSVGGDTSVFHTGSLFCIKQDSSGIAAASPLHPTLPPASTDTFSNDYYAPECKNFGKGGFYNVAIHYESGTNTFNLVVRWTSVHGSTDEVAMSYKAYPGS